MSVSLIKVFLLPVLLIKMQRAAACTCHPPVDRWDAERHGIPATGPRPIMRARGSNDEWMHADDRTFAATHHAHISFEGRDCDGGHGHDRVELPNSAEEAAWNFNMWMRVVESTVNAASDGGTLTTDLTRDGEHRAVWSAPTDEGYERHEAVMCSMTHCAYGRSSQYDQYAELAGY